MSDGGIGIVKVVGGHRDVGIGTVSKITVGMVEVESGLETAPALKSEKVAVEAEIVTVDGEVDRVIEAVVAIIVIVVIGIGSEIVEDPRNDDVALVALVAEIRKVAEDRGVAIVRANRHPGPMTRSRTMNACVVRSGGIFCIS